VDEPDGLSMKSGVIFGNLMLRIQFVSVVRGNKAGKSDFGFIGLFGTAHDNILQFSITQTLVSTFTSSLAVVWYRLATVDVRPSLCSRIVPCFSHQLLKTTDHND
jgi:hypothetical protein